jgi:hypothetical protein
MVVVPAPTDVAATRPAPQALVERRFQSGGREWIARSAGGGAAGTGALGLAQLDAVHFLPAGAERPTHEALTARGRLGDLHESELAALLAGAVPIPSR